MSSAGGGHVTKDYVYDALGRVQSIAHFVDGDADRQYDSGTETLFDKFDYSYFADGSRASETRTNADGTTTVEWSYDGLNRLISEELGGFDGQGDALAYTDTYSFDLSSNRTKLVHDDQTSGGGGSAGPDSTTTYEYDANDRLLAETKDVAGGSTSDRRDIASPREEGAHRRAVLNARPQLPALAELVLKLLQARHASGQARLLRQHLRNPFAHRISQAPDLRHQLIALQAQPAERQRAAKHLQQGGIDRCGGFRHDRQV